jgi:hypothetical protein
MGDPPNLPDDASWTELERTFFASDSPEEPPPQPLDEARRLDDRLPTGLRTTLVLAAVGAHARRMIQAGAAGLVAALSIVSANRRCLAFGLGSSIVLMGLFAGIVASRNGGSTKVATAKTDVPESRLAVAQATPPVPVPASGAAVQPYVPSTANVSAPRADASKRPPRAHRKPAPASSSAKPPLMTAFMDRETYWARQGQSAPARPSRPLFSR